MKQYHKIQSIFKRDPETNFSTFLDGQYSEPEFEYLADAQWEFTEKVDGTSIRILFDGQKLEFRGKSDRAQIPVELEAKLHDLFDKHIEKFKSQFYTSVCFYGEGYGPKIQKGGKYREDQSFVLFDIKWGDWWLKREMVEEIAHQFELDVVPVLGTGTLHEALTLTKEGFNSTWGEFIAEGLILKPTISMQSRLGNRIITKIKHKDFTNDRNNL